MKKVLNILKKLKTPISKLGGLLKKGAKFIPRLVKAPFKLLLRLPVPVLIGVAVVVVVALIIFGVIGLGKGGGAGDGNGDGNTSIEYENKYENESAEISAEVTPSPEATPIPESKPEDNKLDIFEGAILEITVCEEKYFYQNNKIALDEFIEIATTIDGEVVVEITDDLASRRAYEDLINRLKKEGIKYVEE